MTRFKGEKVQTHLVLEHGTSKCPNCSKHKIEFIYFFGSIVGDVCRCEQGLQEEAEGLDHAGLCDRSHFLEANSQGLKTDWNVSVKQDCQVCLFRLHLATVDPALDKSVRKKWTYIISVEEEGWWEGPRGGGGVIFDLRVPSQV